MNDRKIRRETRVLLAILLLILGLLLVMVAIGISRLLDQIHIP